MIKIDKFSQISVCKIIRLIGVILVFVGVASGISGQFRVPLNFVLPILEFLNYPSMATVLTSGLILAICPVLLSKKISSDLKVSMFTIFLLLSSVFGWEALWHLVIPDDVRALFYLPCLVVLSLISIFIFVGVRKSYMSLNKYATSVFVVSLILLGFWTLIGFPQFFRLGVLYYPQIIDIGLSNSFLGILFLNYIDKILFSIFFILICL